jgi:multidrug efflux pump subunit AcrA (membrane-fusion protein)
VTDQDTTDTVDAQAADTDTGTPQAGNDSAQDGAVDSTSLSPEALRKIRSEHRSLRQRNKELEASLAEREKADLTEKQKVERDLTTATAARDQLEAENRTLRAQALAAKVGIRQDAVDLAVAALDWSEITDPTDAKEVERALKELVKARPFLSARSDGLNGGAGRGTGGSGTGDETLTDLLVRATRH